MVPDLRLIRTLFNDCRASTFLLSCCNRQTTKCHMHRRADRLLWSLFLIWASHCSWGVLSLHVDIVLLAVFGTTDLVAPLVGVLSLRMGIALHPLLQVFNTADLVASPVGVLSLHMGVALYFLFSSLNQTFRKIMPRRGSSCDQNSVSATPEPTGTNSFSVWVTLSPSRPTPSGSMDGDWWWIQGWCCTLSLVAVNTAVWLILVPLDAFGVWSTPLCRTNIGCGLIRIRQCELVAC